MLNINELTDKQKEELLKSLTTDLANKAPAPATIPAAVAVSQQSGPLITTGYTMFGSYDREAVIRDVVNEYISQNRAKLIFPNLLANKGAICYQLRDEIMSEFKTNRSMMNGVQIKGASTISDYQSFPPFIVSLLLINTGEVKRLATVNGSGTKLIARHYFRNESTGWEYKWSGQWQLVDSSDNSDMLSTIFYAMCPTARTRDFKEFVERLGLAPVVYLRKDKSLTFWRNGVYDMANQQFMAYDDPAYEDTYGKYVTLRKNHTNHPLGAPWGKVKTCQIDANGMAIEPVFHHSDGTTWAAMDGLKAPFNIGTQTGDAAFTIVSQGAQFMLRGTSGTPGLFHFWINSGGGGSNGKGMLMDIFKRLLEKNADEIGEGDEDLIRGHAVLSYSVEELGDKYNLNAENVLQMSANFGQETNTTVGYIENMRIIKSLSRKEEITIRGIYDKPMQVVLDYVWFVQAANNLPKTREKNGSVISCVAAIPFEKTFGRSKAYIKEDYIRREEVASFYAWYLTVACPMWDTYDQAALEVLSPYKQEMLKNSMTTIQFFDDVLPLLPMDVIPAEFLFSLYERWFELCGIEHQRKVDLTTLAKDMEQYGSNNQYGVRFSKKDGERVTAKDRDYVTDEVEALKRWGTSPRLGPTPYMMKSPFGTVSWKIDWLQLYGKRFNRGVFRRNVSHFNDPAFNQPEINPDDEYDLIQYKDGRIAQHYPDEPLPKDATLIKSANIAM